MSTLSNSHRKALRSKTDLARKSLGIPFEKVPSKATIEIDPEPKKKQRTVRRTKTFAMEMLIPFWGPDPSESDSEFRHLRHLINALTYLCERQLEEQAELRTTGKITKRAQFAIWDQVLGFDQAVTCIVGSVNESVRALVATGQLRIHRGSPATPKTKTPGSGEGKRVPSGNVHGTA